MAGWLQVLEVFRATVELRSYLRDPEADPVAVDLVRQRQELAKAQHPRGEAVEQVTCALLDNAGKLVWLAIFGGLCLAGKLGFFTGLAGA